jgi:hypothetical protein
MFPSVLPTTWPVSSERTSRRYLTWPVSGPALTGITIRPLISPSPRSSARASAPTPARASAVAQPGSGDQTADPAEDVGDQREEVTAQ